MNQTNTLISTVKMHIFLNHIHDSPKQLFSPLKPKNGTNTITDFSFFYKKSGNSLSPCMAQNKQKQKTLRAQKFSPILSLSPPFLSLFPSFPLCQKSQISINHREMLIYFSKKEQFSLNTKIF